MFGDNLLYASSDEAHVILGLAIPSERATGGDRPVSMVGTRKPDRIAELIGDRIEQPARLRRRA